MYQYLFGPVPSRRLGMSLGVDVVPKKICSLDCVYCEVGKTTHLTVKRKDYQPFARIIDELKHYFASGNADPDFITFSGSGEPTLNLHIGEIIRFIKTIKPQLPVAVLTNGTLLHDREVRRSLLAADLVLPSLDAATEDVFRAINRPEPSLTAQRCIDGLIAFRQEFTGKLWLEVFILPGYNDHPAELAALKKAIIAINPDSVQLNTLDRPGTEPGLRPLSADEMARIVEFFDLPHTEVIAASSQRKATASYRSDTERAILETISRRPCTAADLAAMLGLHINELNKYLDVLAAENKIESVYEQRGYFYQLKDK